jgi:hypothetical protein
MNSVTVQSAIQLHLRREGPCTLESLLTRLSQFSWSEIFSVVDQLSREGSLVLRRPGRFGYEVSINSPQVMSKSLPSAPSACNRSSRMDDCTAS